jgi:hypothetical protein
MKKFLQGLVLGAALMYWYLYYSVDAVEVFRHWLDRTGEQYREDQRREEAEQALHGVRFHQDGEEQKRRSG